MTDECFLGTCQNCQDIPLIRKWLCLSKKPNNRALDAEWATLLTVLVFIRYTAAILSHNRKKDNFGGTAKFGKCQRKITGRCHLLYSFLCPPSTYKALGPWKEVFFVDSFQRVFSEHEFSSSPWGHEARMNKLYIYLYSCWKQQQRTSSM